MPLTQEQHHQYRQSVGQLLWLSLVRPDLQHAARDLSKHLVAPTQLDRQQLRHCLRYIRGTQHYQLHLRPQPPPGIHLPLPPGQQIPLLIECYSDSDWAGDINTRQSTSGSLVTLLKNNMRSNSKTQQVIATSMPSAQQYPTPSISSSLSPRLRTTSASRPSMSTSIKPHIVLLCDSSSCNKFGPMNGDQQKNTTYSTSHVVDSALASSWTTHSSTCFQQRTTQQMLSPKPFQLLIFKGIFQLLVCRQILPTKRGITITSALSLSKFFFRNHRRSPQQTRKKRKKASVTTTHLSSSSVGEMHQKQRSNNDNNDDRGQTTRTTKEEEERHPPRQRRRQPQDIKKEEGSKDNKKEDI